MQLSVAQTITSTENNYKANVNIGDRLFVSGPKKATEKKKTDKKKHVTNESQFIDNTETRRKNSYKHSLQG